MVAISGGLSNLKILQMSTKIEYIKLCETFPDSNLGANKML